MPDVNSLIQRFNDFGVAEREAKTYLAMLERGESNATELHRITGLKLTKMYDVLSRMTVRGLCHERVEGRKRFFSAVNPEKVFDTLRTQWKLEVSIKEKVASDVLVKLAETFSQQESNSFLDSIELIRNKAQVHRTYLSMMETTEHEVCVFNRPPFSATTPELFEEQIASQRKAYARGVHNRSIHIEDVFPFDEAEFPKLGSLDEMRFLDSLPIKMFVFDKAKVLIAIPSAPGDVRDFSMIMVDDAGFAIIAQIAFEHYWEKATPLAEALESHRKRKEKSKA